MRGGEKNSKRYDDNTNKRQGEKNDNRHVVKDDKKYDKENDKRHEEKHKRGEKEENVTTLDEKNGQRYDKEHSKKITKINDDSRDKKQKQNNDKRYDEKTVTSPQVAPTLNIEMVGRMLESIVKMLVSANIRSLNLGSLSIQESSTCIPIRLDNFQVQLILFLISINNRTNFTLAVSEAVK